MKHCCFSFYIDLQSKFQNKGCFLLRLVWLLVHAWVHVCAHSCVTAQFRCTLSLIIAFCLSHVHRYVPPQREKWQVHRRPQEYRKEEQSPAKVSPPPLHVRHFCWLLLFLQQADADDDWTAEVSNQLKKETLRTWNLKDERTSHSSTCLITIIIKELLVWQCSRQMGCACLRVIFRNLVSYVLFRQTYSWSNYLFKLTLCWKVKRMGE